jgi:hypothetical protein
MIKTKKVWRNKERENELEMEKYEMQKMVEHFKEQDRLEKENLINKNKRYGQDLLQQKEFIEMEKKIVKNFFLKSKNLILNLSFNFFFLLKLDKRSK